MSVAPTRRRARACGASGPGRGARRTARRRERGRPGHPRLGRVSLSVRMVRRREPVPSRAGRGVVLADDSLLLREGTARLLEEAGFEVVGQAGDAEDLLLKVRELLARRRDRRHPHAADAHRRGAAGRPEIRERYPEVGRARALAVRRGRVRDGAARRQRGGRRLPAQGPRRRRRRVHRRRAPRRRRRLGARPGDRVAPRRPEPPATTRSTLSRRASARCSR